MNKMSYVASMLRCVGKFLDIDVPNTLYYIDMCMFFRGSIGLRAQKTLCASVSASERSA